MYVAGNYTFHRKNANVRVDGKVERNGGTGKYVYLFSI